MSVERSPKLITTYFLVCFSIVICTAFLTLNYWPQTNMEKVSKLKISHGQSLAAISSMMSQKNIISNQWVFEVVTKLKGLDKSIQVGTFRFNSTHTNQDIINNLVFGRPDRKKITFLEGWNMKQVSGHLADVMKFEYDEVISLLKDENFISDLNINSKTLEGYLFPETYYFFEGVDKKTIIKRLVKEHFSFWNEENILKADELGFTPIEIVTLASIIEGEAIYDSERPIISAVYHNRLKKGMKLQADPTVQYIIKDGPRRLLNKDLRIKSLYNTYMYKGLPPGPINSPGLQSLLAALNPQINNYFYFVAKGGGRHSFSKTLKEHNKNVQKWRKIQKNVSK